MKNTPRITQEDYQKILRSLAHLDVCYETDPRRPVLLTLAEIHSQPLVFKLYKTLNKEACNGKANVI